MAFRYVAIVVDAENEGYGAWMLEWAWLNRLINELAETNDEVGIAEHEYSSSGGNDDVDVFVIQL